jgi:hypothetical protein
MRRVKRWLARVPAWVWPAALVVTAWLLPVRHLLSGLLATVALALGVTVVGFVLWVLAGLAMPEPGVRLDGPRALLRHARATVALRVHQVRMALGQAPWRTPQRVVAVTASALCDRVASLPTGNAAFPALEVCLHPRTVTRLDAWMPIEDVAWHWAQAYSSSHAKTPRVSDTVNVVVSRDPTVPLNRAAVRPGFRVPTPTDALAVAEAPLIGRPVAEGSDRRAVARLAPDAPAPSAAAAEAGHTTRLPAAGPRPTETSATETIPLHHAPTVRAYSGPGAAAALSLIPVDAADGRPTGAPPMPVPAPAARIGRAAGADLRLMDPHLSRDHAELRLSDGVWTIVDRNSTGGTRVNGRRLEPGVPERLADGVLVEFGSPGSQGRRTVFGVALGDPHDAHR